MKEMQFPKELRAIARAGAGVNNIPIERCTAQGIVVFNTPGANANSVKEIVVAGLLLASRDILGGSEWVKENADDISIGKDAEKAKKQFAGNEVLGKTLGVIGLGAVGVLVANAAVSLGMKVYGYDPYLSIQSAWHLSPAVQQSGSVEDICAACDYISIHVPATDKTKGMIGAEQIARMRDGVRFLNFARDALVDEEAMAKALESGKVHCYISDFANLVLPHLGASTLEAEDNCAIMAVDELQDYLDNGNISHSVNFPDINAGVCETEARVAVLHKNVPNMLTQITSFFGNHGLNIENLANKARGEYAYTLLDLAQAMPGNTVASLEQIDGVLRVRRIFERS